MSVSLYGSGQTVLQVVSAYKTDTFNTASTTFIDLPSLTVTLTPNSTTSKFLIMFNIGSSSSSSTFSAFYNIVRNGTAIAQPTSGTSPATVVNYFGGAGTAFNIGMNYLDSPATTSPITYKIQTRTDGGTLYVGQINSNANYTSISSITVMEISGS